MLALSLSIINLIKGRSFSYGHGEKSSSRWNVTIKCDHTEYIFWAVLSKVHWFPPLLKIEKGKTKQWEIKGEWRIWFRGVQTFFSQRPSSSMHELYMATINVFKGVLCACWHIYCAVAFLSAVGEMKNLVSFPRTSFPRTSWKWPHRSPLPNIEPTFFWKL